MDFFSEKAVLNIFSINIINGSIFMLSYALSFVMTITIQAKNNLHLPITTNQII